MQVTQRKTNKLHMVVAGFVAVLVTVVCVALMMHQPAHAATDVIKQGCSTAGAGASGNPLCSGTSPDEVPNTIGRIISALLFLLGMVAVIMIIVGGFRYVTSNGDQGQIKQAKDTIMYSVVGLVVAIMAGAIVSFVISRV